MAPGPRGERRDEELFRQKPGPLRLMFQQRTEFRKNQLADMTHLCHSQKNDISYCIPMTINVEHAFNLALIGAYIGLFVFKH